VWSMWWQGHDFIAAAMRRALQVDPHTVVARPALDRL
jgi:hypothetical protein